MLKKPSRSARPSAFKVGQALAEWGLTKDQFLRDEERQMKENLALIQSHSRQSRQDLKMLERKLREQKRTVKALDRHKKKLMLVNRAIEKNVAERIRLALANYPWSSG